MWKLQRAERRTETIGLVPGKEYVVGRKNCDILLSNDQSISRVHAHLTVTDQVVTVKDSSKYGTFVNDEQLETGSSKTLHPGDRLTFGVFESKFRLELDSVVVCSSCVDTGGKAALSRAVETVGGRVVSAWTQDCTHLVMPVVKVTIKTICALLCCRPIVKPEFFAELSSAVQRREALPKADSFRPEIDEPSLTKQDVDLQPQPKRRTLFKDKTFVFLNTKQMKRLSQAVSCGGGRSQLLEEGSVPVLLLESPRTCVIDVGTGSSQALMTPSTKKWVDSVGQVLHRNGLRFITESEIGLAAIYVNSQTYCNPHFTLDSESVRVRPVIPGASLSQNATVDETVLPAVSQNITAYVSNTEPSQGISGVKGKLSECTTVGETPEKRPGNTRGATGPSARPSATSAVPESGRKTDASVDVDQNKESTPQPVPAQHISATLKKSPQKQLSLTNYFQPVGNKRLREGDEDCQLSEAKLSRRDGEDEENRKTKSSSLAVSASLDAASERAGQKHRTDPRCPDFSASLGLGSGLGTSSGPGESHRLGHCNPSADPGLKKRKEPEQSGLPDLEASAEMDECDMFLDELESIMSVDMDEPLQPAANKKQRVDRGIAVPINQRRVEKQQSVTSKSQDLENKGPSAASSSHGSEKKPQSSSNRVQDLGQEENSSVTKKDRSEPEDIKEEDVSLAVATMNQNSFPQTSKVDVIKQDPMVLISVTGAENDPELPRKVMQIQFKALTVGAPCRLRSEPLRRCDSNTKNFKRFRKLSVPGLHGLPSIIGGADLVAHNRSKKAELEEWLRDAAKEEKQQEQEDALGEDLFRYNPKTTKRR